MNKVTNAALFVVEVLTVFTVLSLTLAVLASPIVVGLTYNWWASVVLVLLGVSVAVVVSADTE